MLRSSYSKKMFFFLSIMQCMVIVCMAQVKYHASSNMYAEISGTSTLHSWNMKTTSGECKATFTMNAADHLTDLVSLSLSIPATSLKSNNKSMDKNAYKALKTKENESITFDLTSATLFADGTIKCLGKLTIAGTSIDTDLTATTKVNADKTIDVKGTKKISMKEFNMIPPTFMLGAVKTGNDIILTFDLTMTKI